MNLSRWQALMQAWGFAANEKALRALQTAYSETCRHYHSAEHIEACLHQLDVHATHAEHPREVELALWFHDAVYHPLSSGNEEKSAAWAAHFLEENGALPEERERVRSLILVTAHDAPACTPDEALLLDLDLSILGADATTYDAYEAAIRREYHLVPMPLYRRKRAEVLKGFLNRNPLYLTPSFRAQLEAQARINLARAIAALA